MSDPAFTVAPAMKFVPVSVTGTLDPAPPEFGLIPLRAGGGGLIVNTVAGEVPPDVVTVTFVAPGVAFAAIPNVAVIWVAFTTTRLLTVMLAPAFTVAPVTKLVPVSVTGTLVPAVP